MEREKKRKQNKIQITMNSFAALFGYCISFSLLLLLLVLSQTKIEIVERSIFSPKITMKFGKHTTKL